MRQQSKTAAQSESEAASRSSSRKVKGEFGSAPGGFGGEGVARVVANHHFIPGLVSPADVLVRVGVRGVVFAVVVTGGDDKLGTDGHIERLFEAIFDLPIEVVVRQVEKRRPL